MLAEEQLYAHKCMQMCKCPGEQSREQAGGRKLMSDHSASVS